MGAVQDVVAAILINNNKVLIAQRNKDDHLAGLWEFPGGKMELGERPSTAGGLPGPGLDKENVPDGFIHKGG